MPTRLCPPLWFLIWEFGWDFRPKEHPFVDVERVRDIQRSIPACFLRDRVPPRGWLVPPSVAINQLYQLFPLNPFRRGNPYRPFGTVDPDFFIWSYLPSLLIAMLTKPAIRQLVTYRGILERRLVRHYNRRILQWNKSLEELFLPLSDLAEEHFRDDLWKVPFNSLVLGPLQEAAWLSTALPSPPFAPRV